MSRWPSTSYFLLPQALLVLPATLGREIPNLSLPDKFPKDQDLAVLACFLSEAHRLILGPSSWLSNLSSRWAPQSNTVLSAASPNGPSAPLWTGRLPGPRFHRGMRFKTASLASRGPSLTSLSLLPLEGSSTRLSLKNRSTPQLLANAHPIRRPLLLHLDHADQRAFSRLSCRHALAISCSRATNGKIDIYSRRQST